MFRIKYLLGSMVTIFSLVYFLFGGVGWYMGDASYQDILTCFVLASLHLAGGSWLLLSSLRDYRAERERLETVIRHLISSNGGRVPVQDLARVADINEDDARDYLEKRSKSEPSYVSMGRNGHDTYYFGQNYRDN